MGAGWGKGRSAEDSYGTYGTYGTDGTYRRENGVVAELHGAAAPEVARAMFDRFVELLRQGGVKVETGVFGAMMGVSLVNDGPVTIWLDSAEVLRGEETKE